MHFNELKIYQISSRLSVEIEKLINDIPFHWRIKETGQIKRSSSSSPANMAEGFAKRIYPKEFIRYLNIALGSSDESQHHIFALYKKGYIDKKNFEYFSNQFQNLSIKTLNLIKSIAKNSNVELK